MIDSTFVISSIGFGILIGWILGRNPADRRLVLSVAAVCTTVGALSWMVSSAGTLAETAGVSLTIGCPVVAIVALMTGRRPDGRTESPPPAPR